MPDAETSTSEEPGAQKGHAGIRAGAVRATGRPTAMAVVADKVIQRNHGWTNSDLSCFRQF